MKHLVFCDFWSSIEREGRYCTWVKRANTSKTNKCYIFSHSFIGVFGVFGVNTQYTMSQEIMSFPNITFIVNTCMSLMMERMQIYVTTNITINIWTSLKSSVIDF